MKITKTNALRILDAQNISYEVRTYPDDGPINGTAVAAYLGEDPAQVYKTLVTTGASKQHYVFCIPVEAHLDLKKAAKAVNEKNIEMLPQKELLPLTGYVHGGCSPVGMKKPFPTVIQEDCILYEDLYVSAGKIGMQMHIQTNDLIRAVGMSIRDVIEQ